METIPSDPLLGTQLGGCVLEHLIGSGATGSVYRAHQLSLDRYVAIKILHPHVAVRETIVTRFAREARAAARLHHPHLVQVHDFGCENGFHFYTMELVEGLSLGDTVKRGHIFGESECLNICRQAVSALAAAHAIGIVHRDLKPDNMLLDSVGLLKISDLGLAQTFETTTEMGALTLTGDALGTPYYMSPEQVQDARNVDYRTDYYSLGASLYHLATGSPPYDGESRFSVMARHVNDPVPYARNARPDLTVSFSHLISRLMAKDPALRPSTAEEILELVDACERALASGIDMNASLPVGLRSSGQLKEQVPRNFLTSVAAVAAGVALVAIAAFYALRHVTELSAPVVESRLRGPAAASVMALRDFEKLMHRRSPANSVADSPQKAQLPSRAPWDFSLAVAYPAARLIARTVWRADQLPPAAFTPSPASNGTKATSPIDKKPEPLKTAEILASADYFANRTLAARRLQRHLLRVFEQNPPLVMMRPPAQNPVWALQRGNQLLIRPTWPPYSKDIERRMIATADDPTLKATLVLFFTQVTAPGRIRIDIEKVSGPGTLPPRTIASAAIQPGRAVLVDLDVTSTFAYQMRRGTVEDYIISYDGAGVVWLSPEPEPRSGTHLDLILESSPPDTLLMRPRGSGSFR